ncbi:MAG TPA: tripartite tricarboxylate transporter substrate binding protein [Burkholderiales bacterium]|nr:tripartite tricarboxylate transporter substrate binding protein [Burkholderiales bacterium]
MQLKQILTLISWMGFAAAPYAQTYPAKSVRIIVPFAAGGNTDFTGRTIAAKLTESLGQQFLVDNRPGGSTNIGSDMIVKSAPDGYNILLGGAANAINVAALAKVPFDLQRDLAPIILCVKGANVLSIHPSLPVKNLKEFIALAKAKPGQLNYGTAGVASSNHMAGELLKHMADININHIPYKGNAPALTDLIGGHVEMIISGVPALIPHIKSGRIRSIAIGSLKRFAAIPEVPTFDEQGLKGYEASTWFGLMAPIKTPREIITKLNTEVGKILAGKDIRDRYQVEGLEPQGGSPEDFAKFIRTEIDLYTRLVKVANLPKQ